MLLAEKRHFKDVIVSGYWFTYDNRSAIIQSKSQCSCLASMRKRKKWKEKRWLVTSRGSKLVVVRIVRIVFPLARGK